MELYDSSSAGILVNLKNILLSKKIAVRTAVDTIGSNTGTSGAHKKGTTSLPG